MARPLDSVRFAAILLGSLLSGCRREVQKLEPIQKMAYEVRPAIVRVNAGATGSFRYPTRILASMQQKMRARHNAALLFKPPATAEAQVETGAGGSGSGFIVHPSGYILTSSPVVRATQDRENLQRELRRNGATAVLLESFPLDALRRMHRDGDLDAFIAELADSGRIDNLTIANDVELSNGERLGFSVVNVPGVQIEKDSEIALIRVDRLNLPSVRLGESATVPLREPIWVIGYPALAGRADAVIGGWTSITADLEASFNPGAISSIKRNASGDALFQTNAAMDRGSSGGPAVNRAGEVIAISSWKQTGVEQVKSLVSISGGRKLLAAARIPSGTRGAFQALYEKSLGAAAAGDWASAKRPLSEAVRLFPNSPDLIRLTGEADRALPLGAAWKRHPFTTVSLAALLLLIFAVPASLMARSRSRRVHVGSPGRPVAQSPESTAPRSFDGSVLGLFTILNGERAGEKLGLGGSGIRIGREQATCEIVLEDPKVSRLHAELVAVDGRVVLIDRNSSNGTYVNDQKIERQILRDGDIIYFGGRNAIAVAFHA